MHTPVSFSIFSLHTEACFILEEEYSEKLYYILFQFQSLSKSISRLVDGKKALIYTVGIETLQGGVQRKAAKMWKFHSIQSKILILSVSIALGTTIVSLAISYYAEIDTIKSTTELYMTQYISFADESFNSMLTDARKMWGNTD